MSLDIVFISYMSLLINVKTCSLLMANYELMNSNCYRSLKKLTITVGVNMLKACAFPLSWQAVFLACKNQEGFDKKRILMLFYVFCLGKVLKILFKNLTEVDTPLLNVKRLYWKNHYPSEIIRLILNKDNKYYLWSSFTLFTVFLFTYSDYIATERYQETN